MPGSALALDPRLPPGKNFDLTHWKLTLPDVSEIPAAQLSGGYSSPWFNTGSDGSMIFWCPVTGTNTTTSSFPRSELRELMDPKDSDVNWTGYGLHHLSGQCKVLQLPSTGKVIIGQIHSKSGNAYPLVMLMYDNGNIRALVRQSPNTTVNVSYGVGRAALNDTIDYEIDLTDGLLSTSVNGATLSTNIFLSDPAWAAQTFYFKAGAYCQDNSGTDTEGARVAFSQVVRTHLSAPVPIRLALAKGAMVVSWVATPGKAYQVNAMNGLGQAQWQVLADNLVFSGSNGSFTNALGTNRQRFFRVFEK